MIGMVIVGVMLLTNFVVFADQHMPTVALWINGTEVEADSPPLIVNDRSMVPLRVITENMGGRVVWNDGARRAEVTTPAKMFGEKWAAEGMLMWQPEDAAMMVAMEDAMVLDVRPADMFAADGVPGALNIPVPQLGDRLGELDRDMTYAVYCASDINAAYAVAILTMNNFDAYVIVGGRVAFMDAWNNLDMDAITPDEEPEEEEPMEEAAAILSVEVVIDEAAGTRTTQGQVSGDIEQVSIGSLRDLDNYTYADTDRGHGAVMVDVMADGTFSYTITPGADRPHPVMPGRHQTRVAILDESDNIVTFMDSAEFTTP